MTPEHPNDLSESEKDKYLRIYLAEFEALSNRLTYWLTLQYVPYGIAAVALGYFVDSWNDVYPYISSNLAWAALLILQLLMWAVLQSTHEVFTYVVYFKECLKPKIRQLLQESGPSFLDFEPFLTKLRQRWFLRFETTFGLMAIAIAAMISLCAAAIYNTPTPKLCRGSTIAWAVTNGYLVFILLGKARNIQELQKRAEAPDYVEPVCP